MTGRAPGAGAVTAADVTAGAVPDLFPASWNRFAMHERMNVNLTLKCNMECAHCNVEAGPRRNERLSDDEVREALAAGKQAGKRHVTFSGGEAFLRYEALQRYAAWATDLGFAVDVETNAYWARTEQTGVTKLRPLAAAGVAGLVLSADAYHEAFHPTERSIHAARAARSLGLSAEINFCPSPDAAADAYVLEVLDSSGEPYFMWGTLDIGRAREIVTLSPTHRPAEFETCSSLNLTVHATGQVFACCELNGDNRELRSSAVYLGNTAGDGADFEGYRLVRAFYDESSPAFFKDLVDTHPAFADLRDRKFRSICDFCMRALGDERRVDAIRRLLDA